MPAPLGAPPISHHERDLLERAAWRREHPPARGTLTQLDYDVSFLVDLVAQLRAGLASCMTRAAVLSMLQAEAEAEATRLRKEVARNAQVG